MQTNRNEYRQLAKEKKRAEATRIPVETNS